MASQFSIFAPSGIRFTRRKPHSERIYETLREAWGTLFTDDPEAAINVETFAQAKCLGQAKEQLERAGNQANPRHVTELLPKLEADYQIVPAPDATVQQRRAELVAARAARGGARLNAMREGLTALLGADLLALVPHTSTTTTYPSGSMPDGDPGNFVPLGREFKTIELTTSTLQSPVGYRWVAGEKKPLTIGEKLTIDTGLGLTETVAVLGSYSTDYPTSLVGTFTATFQKPHASGTHCTTAAVPYWLTVRRFLYVVVSDAALNDPVRTQRVHDYMSRAVTHATQWAIVGSSGAGTAGPFILGSSLLGQTPITQVSY